MYAEFVTHSRDEFISLGQALGLALKPLAEQEQKIILLGGHGNSGKSLLALAMDSVFRPEEYEDCIPLHLSADSKLDSSEKFGLPVTFNNFACRLEESDPAFDRILKNFAGRNTDAKLVIAANINRHYLTDFNYKANGLHSRNLDLYVDVRGKIQNPHSFQRTTTIYADKPDVIQALYSIKIPTSKEHFSYA
jgi:hypothetical protein